jgi:cell division protein FtsB
MKTTILQIIIFLVCILFVSRPTVNFRPFSLQFERGYYALGLFLVLLGVQFIVHGIRKETKMEMYDFLEDKISELAKIKKEEKEKTEEINRLIP